MCFKVDNLERSGEREVATFSNFFICHFGSANFLCCPSSLLKRRLSLVLPLTQYKLAARGEISLPRVFLSSEARNFRGFIGVCHLVQRSESQSHRDSCLSGLNLLLCNFDDFHTTHFISNGIDFWNFEFGVPFFTVTDSWFR